MHSCDPCYIASHSKIWPFVEITKKKKNTHTQKQQQTQNCRIKLLERDGGLSPPKVCFSKSINLTLDGPGALGFGEFLSFLEVLGFLVEEANSFVEALFSGHEK